MASTSAASIAEYSVNVKVQLEAMLLEGNWRNKAGFRAVGPDSYYLPGFLTPDDTASLERQMTECGPWQERDSPAMKMRGHLLKRTKFFLVAGKPCKAHPYLPSKVPSYSYPGKTWSSMLGYRTFDTVPLVKPVVDRIKPWVETTQMIGTLYIDGKDCIGEHRDKMKDIQPGSSIPILSFGATRSLQLSAAAPVDGKEDNEEDEEDNRPLFAPKQQQQQQKKKKRKRSEATFKVEHDIPLEAGSLFILGPITNHFFKHRIPKLPSGVKIGPRMSLIFRHIVTMVPVSTVIARATKAEQERVKRALAKQAKQAKRAAPRPDDDVGNKKTKRQKKENQQSSSTSPNAALSSALNYPSSSSPPSSSSSSSYSSEWLYPFEPAG